uniref:AAA+ ATPase domain-containing protein n=1 Tax=Setaria digitata TaxID=48799 RepID=A0A915PSS3_9BILA
MKPQDSTIWLRNDLKCDEWDCLGSTIRQEMYVVAGFGEKQMTSVNWFCSSFESSSSSDHSLPSHRLLKKQCVPRNLDNGNNCELTEVYVEEESCNSCQKESYSLIDRFAPHNVEQLAVNPRKIDGVRCWMRKKKKHSRENKLLLLTGPTGSGKTAAVQMLCRELKLELIEWNCSESYEVFYGPEGEEIRKFAEFLKSSDRGSLEKSAAQKVVLIEQLPNVFYQDPSVLHATLQNTVKNTVCMYIFVMSDVESCWYLSPKRILPSNIRVELGFEELAFNASATTFLSKALRRIASLLHVNVSPSQVKRIAEISNGDIRTAIHNLQLCIDDCKKFNEVIPLHSSTLIDPYHSLGKLLYAKRCDKTDDNWKRTEEMLKIELRKVWSRGYPPKDDVNEVLEKSGMDGDKLVMFLHEHELNFAPSLSSYLDILNNISLFDSILGRWEVRMNSVLCSYMSEFRIQEENLNLSIRIHFALLPMSKEVTKKKARKKLRSSVVHKMNSSIRTLPLIRLIRPTMLNNYQYQVLVSMDCALCASFTVNSARKNERPSHGYLANDEENQFDIEEIDLS